VTRGLHFTPRPLELYDCKDDSISSVGH